MVHYVPMKPKVPASPLERVAPRRMGPVKKEERVFIVELAWYLHHPPLTLRKWALSLGTLRSTMVKRPNTVEESRREPVHWVRLQDAAALIWRARLEQEAFFEKRRLDFHKVRARGAAAHTKEGAKDMRKGSQFRVFGLPGP